MINPLTITQNPRNQTIQIDRLHKIWHFSLTERLKDRSTMRSHMGFIDDGVQGAVAGMQMAFLLAIVGGISILILNRNILEKAESSVGGI